MVVLLLTVLTAYRSCRTSADRSGRWRPLGRRCRYCCAGSRRRPPPEVIAKGVPWQILAFLLSVFVLALALRNAGVVDWLSDRYEDAALGVIGLASAVGSASIGNHPMALMNLFAIERAHGLGEREILAALIGGDLGPRLLRSALSPGCWGRLAATSRRARTVAAVRTVAQRDDPGMIIRLLLAWGPRTRPQATAESRVVVPSGCCSLAVVDHRSVPLRSTSRQRAPSVASATSHGACTAWEIARGSHHQRFVLPSTPRASPNPERLADRFDVVIVDLVRALWPAISRSARRVCHGNHWPHIRARTATRRTPRRDGASSSSR